MIFESERLYVRPYTEADADNFYLLNSDEDIVRYIRAPKTRAETDSFLKEVMEAYLTKTAFRWALIRKSDDVFIGSFAVIPLKATNQMQLGYALLKNFWGKGYASEITVAGIKYALEVMNLDSIFAVTQVPNIASQKVLLKSGFTQLPNYVEDEKELCLFKISKPGYD